MGGRRRLNTEVCDNGQDATARLVALGLLSLVLGLTVYLSDRPAASAYFLAADPATAALHGRSFGPLGQWLPAFLHVYAFILFTAAVVVPRGRGVAAVCTAWFAVDTLFECGQHPAIAPDLAALIPRWFQGIPVLENTANYFVRGVFDPIDILFIALGAIAACATIGIAVTHRRTACAR
jgi:hypothetical protein